MPELTAQRPILFQTPLTRAILDNAKTQTRRVRGLEELNTYPGRLTGDSPLGPLGYRGLMPSTYTLHPKRHREYKRNPGLYHWFQGMQEIGEHRELNPIPVRCPYGAVGDLLWVRSTWGWFTTAYHDREGINTRLMYRAQFDEAAADEEDIRPEYGWRSPYHLKREDALIWLRLTDVRAERLQDISDEDAMAEGVREHIYPACGDHPTLVGYVTDADGEFGAAHVNPDQAFAKLWDSINGKKPGCAWADNPFVWALTFERIDKPVAIQQTEEVSRDEK